MENVKIFIGDIQKDVYGIFYIYNSKYYFIYTEKELDENGYGILYLVQIAKETQNTPNGPIDTGYMVGFEITDEQEQKLVQESISYIVEDKKNNTTNSNIQYLSTNMLGNLKILSKKRFRLLKSILIDNFKINFDENIINNTVQMPEPVVQPAAEQIQMSEQSVQTVFEPSQIPEPVAPVVPGFSIVDEDYNNVNNQISNENIVIDYRVKFFEAEEKNKELQARIDELTRKLDEIKKVIE